ncbi:acyl carrier protein [Nostoc sp. UCD121]|uniref:phosphopantetheine-binding protein n=1 Tax=unclassified Nostoc TaxID=2593658 RepID=UPI001623F6CD|nr:MULTISPECIES: acyl carrier protein [unclassified Nostoc]MBC1219226.1 acyl carrier protein [Nostoc sp. UCD120]MBC1274625.1 acyl carrier protein [Nostoc sp. UCD121]MBC1295494.1 acyl carrier protein [Nostoc sp. UCD122]
MSQSISETTKKQSYTAEEIQAWLVSHIAEQLGVEPKDIDVRQPLDSYGLESAQAMVLVSKAEKLFGFELSPILLWRYPTIETLSQRLAEESKASQSETFEI